MTLTAQPSGTVPLYRLAHSRAGDKGNRSNLSLIAYDPAHYDLLVEQVTADAVARWFGYRQPAHVERYLLPTLCAMNFVLDDVLDGGVNGSLNLDAHGKGLSFWLLDMPVTPPPGFDANGDGIIERAID
ncbi:hypothetical protein GCM10007242_46490 [Pigmentiphaga litoralis]|jgi:hypothetical protein|uniref:AtuA-related protein n=1 Tax=Pigmentiphaga litoralis TaxID=516702 RepID=UPI0016768201|nr:hypothetical protein [Pigmentiphaga litoralis]GGX34341.1 hypothetical protein GCM10007242_46490 [Pigmentiphaga litoralis]